MALRRRQLAALVAALCAVAMVAVTFPGATSSLLQVGYMPPAKVGPAPIPLDGFTNVDTALGKLEARIGQMAAKQEDINQDSGEINARLHERDSSLSEAQGETLDQHE